MTDPSVVVRGAPREVGVQMMASLYQHRLLSTEQLHAMHCPHTSQQWSRHVLRELRDAGYITSTNKHGSAPGEPMRLWFLTERGASSVELTPQGEERRIIVSDAGAAGQLQAHTLAVNDVGIAFINAARAPGQLRPARLAPRSRPPHRRRHRPTRRTLSLPA